MNVPPKNSLMLPLSDSSDLPAFVAQYFLDCMGLVAVWGPGADGAEDALDWLIMGDGSLADECFYCTLAHGKTDNADEGFQQACAFAQSWTDGGTLKVVEL